VEGGEYSWLRKKQSQQKGLKGRKSGEEDEIMILPMKKRSVVMERFFQRKSKRNKDRSSLILGL
jgi:hypothetical protein